MFVSKQLSESKEVEPESDQAEDGMETVEEEEGSMDVDVGNTSADVLEMSFCESLRVRRDWPCTVGCIGLCLHVTREHYLMVTSLCFTRMYRRLCRTPRLGVPTMSNTVLMMTASSWVSWGVWLVDPCTSHVMVL